MEIVVKTIKLIDTSLAFGLTELRLRHQHISKSSLNVAFLSQLAVDQIAILSGIMTGCDSVTGNISLLFLVVESLKNSLFFDLVIICGAVDIHESFGCQIFDLLKYKLCLLVRIRHRIKDVLIIVLGAVEVEILAISVK